VKTFGKRLGSALVVAAFILAAAVLAAMVFAPKGHADDYDPGCDQVGWGFLGLTQKRLICDGPRRPDGSWERYREIYTPAGYVSASSYCGTYSCSYSPGYYRERSTQELTHYTVFDSNVLDGEPGWLPPGSLNLR
jgi:hypothetical protein